MPYGWDDSYGARLGVMPLDRPGEVRWFDVDPAYVFHVGNAHTDAAGRVVLDAARYAPADAVAMWDGLGHDPAGHAAAAAATGAARLHRWVLDPATGAVTETPLADRPVEFPTVDDERVGRDARYRYAVTDTGDAAGIVKFDARDGRGHRARGRGRDRRRRGRVRPECRGRPRAEDDGWLLTITTRRDGSASQLLVLDATDVAGRPVAAVTLPRGVPSGFHGSWIADDELARRARAVTDAEGGTGQDASAEVQRHFSPRLMVRGLAWDVGLPLVAYYALHLLGASDWVGAPDGLLRRSTADRLGRCPRPAAQPVRRHHARGLRQSAWRWRSSEVIRGSSCSRTRSSPARSGLTFVVTTLFGRPLTLAAMQSFTPAQGEFLARAVPRPMRGSGTATG